MTSPSQSVGPDQAATPYSPRPTKFRRTPIVMAAAVGLAVLVVAAAALVWIFNSNDLPQETAQRECRTALEREARQRADGVGTVGDIRVLVSVTGLEIEETWEIENGYAVNGTVKYTLTTPLLGQTPNAVSLTCEATAADDGTVKTTIKNRL